MEILYCSLKMFFISESTLGNHAIWLDRVLFMFTRGLYKFFFSGGLTFPEFNKTENLQTKFVLFR